MLFDFSDWAYELVYLLRMLIALLLGFGIGFERKLRSKEAGLRTHSIVAAGSCLFMLVSKYGFKDIAQGDGARIAAQVVSGIGFIGAGIIIYKKQILSGLSTAAGIWTTAGVGMAVGAGLYILAVGGAVLIVLIQFITHMHFGIFKQKQYMTIKVVFVSNNEEYKSIMELFDVKKFVRIGITRKDDDIINTVYINTEKFYHNFYLNQMLRENPFILSIERADDY